MELILIILLILFLFGGVGWAVVSDLLWIALLIILIGAILGAFSYRRYW